MGTYSVDILKKKTVSPVFRGSYVNILEARELPESSKMAYGIQCRFPKSDPNVEAWRKDLNKIYAQVLIDKMGEQKGLKLAPLIKTPLRDGDDPKVTMNMADPSGLEGTWFLNANNIFRQPYVIGANGQPVDPATLTPDDIYSGAWYRAMLEFWYYDQKGNKGISCSVAAVMKVKDDESLGGGTTQKEASSAFEEFASEAASMFKTDSDNEESQAEMDAKTEAEDTGFNFM